MLLVKSHLHNPILQIHNIPLLTSDFTGRSLCDCYTYTTLSTLIHPIYTWFLNSVILILMLQLVQWTCYIIATFGAMDLLHYCYSWYHESVTLLLHLVPGTCYITVSFGTMSLLHYCYIWYHESVTLLFHLVPGTCYIWNYGPVTLLLHSVL